MSYILQDNDRVTIARRPVKVTVTGRTREPVVLSRLRVRVVERDRPPELTAYSMGDGCGSGITPQTFDVDLDAPRPYVKAVAGQDGDRVVPAKDFPYRVATGDAEVLNLDVDEGILVQDVTPDGPADDAGIEAGDATVGIAGAQVRAGGDVITEVDGRQVGGMDDLIAAVNAKEPGDEVTLTVLRDGSGRDVTVELGDRPDSVRG